MLPPTSTSGNGIDSSILYDKFIDAYAMHITSVYFNLLFNLVPHFCGHPPKKIQVALSKYKRERSFDILAKMIKSLILLVFLCGSSNALVLSTTACTTNFANANDCENALFSEYGTSGFYFNFVWHDYETEGAGYNVNNDACGSGATYACYSVYDSSSFTDVILYGCASGSKNFYICDETASPTS